MSLHNGILWHILFHSFLWFLRFLFSHVFWSKKGQFWPFLALFGPIWYNFLPKQDQSFGSIWSTWVPFSSILIPFNSYFSHIDPFLVPCFLGIFLSVLWWCVKRFLKLEFDLVFCVFRKLTPKLGVVAPITKHERKAWEVYLLCFMKSSTWLMGAKNSSLLLSKTILKSKKEHSMCEKSVIGQM